jgi:hypothetical protein
MPLLPGAFAAGGQIGIDANCCPGQQYPVKERRAAVGTQERHSREIFELVAEQIIPASWEKPDDTRLEDIKRNNIKAWEDPR